MMKRSFAAVIFSGLVLACAPLIGCGETDDPTGNQDQNQENQENQNQENQNQENQNQNDEECTEDSDCDDGEVCEDNVCVDDENGEDPECEHDTDCDGDKVCEDNVCVDPNGNGEDPECTSDLDCPGDQVCEGEGEDAECVDPPEEFDCEVNDDFYGQIGFDEDVDNSGGEPTTDAFDTDAGLGDVIDAIEAEFDGTIDGQEDEVCVATEEKRDFEEDDDGDTVKPYEDCAELSEPISVEGATVTAVEFIGFWVQDSEAAIYVFNSNNNEHVEIDNPDVGQKVNFEVDIAGTHFADPQITGLSNWEVVEDDAPVSFHDIGDEPITNDDHYNQVVRLGGELGTGENDSYECGTFFGSDQICYNMYFGDEGEHSVTFRTSKDDSIWEPGDCLTYVGPVQSHPGLYSGDGEPQLQESNWDWTSWPSFD